MKLLQDINKLLFALSILLSTLSITSCRKLVEAPIPSESIADENVYSTDATSIAVLDGIYISMNANYQPFQGAMSINLLAGLSADELTLYSGYIGSENLFNNYYINRLTQAQGGLPAGAEQWSPLYNYVFRCNAAIEGLNKSSSLTPTSKQQLLGEAKFLRAFYYFYLVNLFGDVPMAITTDPELNTKLIRSTKVDVYKQIVTDLKEAEELLSDNFLDGTLSSTTTERVRPTKWAASALLARVYLYTNDFVNAEDRSTAVINNTSLFGPLPSLNDAFLKNSREAIWQLQPTDIDLNTTEAQTLVLTALGPGYGNPVYLSNQWLNNFETGDQRKELGNWVNSSIYNVTGTTLDTVYYCNKYKVNTSPGITTTNDMSEYFMMLRVGEQYLIRSEARARLGNISGAQDDLNTIRKRAGLPNTAAADETALVIDILHERQVELFCEWGNRWFDLKRTNNIDAVMAVATPLKSNGATTWQSYQKLYPLPYSDLFINNVPNPYLTQNIGY
ncbi:MAG: RagB/SusD family nutrient uptake outer membrane protein [Chitinophagaceae bacterium]